MMKKYAQNVDLYTKLQVNGQLIPGRHIAYIAAADQLVDDDRVRLFRIVRKLYAIDFTVIKQEQANRPRKFQASLATVRHVHIIVVSERGLFRFKFAMFMQAEEA
jgi:hypothetical protein